MSELILDGGENLEGGSRLLKLNITPDGDCVTLCTQSGVAAVLDRAQQRRLVAYLAKQLWPLALLRDGNASSDKGER